MAYMDLGTVEDAEEAAISRLDDIDQLGNVIVRYGYGGLLGVSLLHRHYGIDQNEILMTDEADGCLVSKPVPALTAGLIERRWAWDHNLKSWLAYEYIAQSAICVELPAIRKLEKDEAFWSDLGQVVENLGLSGLFGVTLHDPRTKKMSSKKALLEINAEDARRTIVCEVPAESVGDIDAGVTVWNFFSNGLGKQASLACAAGNTQHCCGNIERARELLASINAPVHLLNTSAVL